MRASIVRGKTDTPDTDRARYPIARAIRRVIYVSID